MIDNSAFAEADKTYIANTCSQINYFILKRF